MSELPLNTQSRYEIGHIVDNSNKRRWIYSRLLWCLIAVFLAVFLGIPVGFTLRIRDFSVPPQSDLNNSTIQLTTVLVDIDPRLETMTLYWGINNATCYSQPCETYDIFFDNSLLFSESKDDKNPTANNSVPDTPIFSVDSGQMDNVFAKTAFFTTKVSLFPGAATGHAKRRSLQSYPFDRYQAEIFIFAKNRNDSSDDPTHHVSTSIIQSWGIAPGFKTKVYSGENDTFVFLEIDISRGIEVRLYAVIIVTATWLVTLVLLSATITSVFLGHRIAKEVLLIPVATLFAFTSLRGSLPGAPEGAIMDYIGILPCLAILTFCSVLHLGIFLIRNPEKDWDDVEGKIK